MPGRAMRLGSFTGVVVLTAVLASLLATGCGDTNATTSAPLSTAPATTGGSTTVATAGTTPLVTVAPAPTARSGPASTDAAKTEGATLFADNCAACHGARGEGGAGSDLRPFSPDDASLAAAIADIINSGGGDMPAFSGRFDSGQMNALVAYVLGL